MKTAKVNVGGVLISLPKGYLDQQTAISSVFDNVPTDMVDMDTLIEANKTNKNLTWYKNGEHLHISVPTELIEWE